MSATLPLPVLLARATGIGSLIPAMLAKGIRALVQSREYVFFAALIAMLFDPLTFREFHSTGSVSCFCSL